MFQVVHAFRIRCGKRREKKTNCGYGDRVFEICKKEKKTNCGYSDRIFEICKKGAVTYYQPRQDYHPC